MIISKNANVANGLAGERRDAEAVVSGRVAERLGCTPADVLVAVSTGVIGRALSVGPHRRRHHGDADPAGGRPGRAGAAAGGS